MPPHREALAFEAWGEEAPRSEPLLAAGELVTPGPARRPERRSDDAKAGTSPARTRRAALSRVRQQLRASAAVIETEAVRLARAQQALAPFLPEEDPQADRRPDGEKPPFEDLDESLQCVVCERLPGVAAELERLAAVRLGQPWPEPEPAVILARILERAQGGEP